MNKAKKRFRVKLICEFIKPKTKIWLNFSKRFICSVNGFFFHCVIIRKNKKYRTVKNYTIRHNVNFFANIGKTDAIIWHIIL